MNKIGTLNDGDLTSTWKNAFVAGRAGDDTIKTKSGADAIWGGDGDEHAPWWSGDDVIYTGTGREFVYGGGAITPL